MATRLRVPAMFVTGALVLFLASTSAAGPIALCSSPADPCGRLSDLNKEYADLQLQIVQDRAMLQQFGFQANVDQFEKEAAYYDDLIKRHPIVDSVRGAFYDTSLEVIKRNLDAMTTPKAAQMAEAAKKIPGVGERFANDIKDIAMTPAGQARLAKYLKVMEYMGPALNVFKLGTAEDTRGIVEEALSQMMSTLITESSLLSAATRATMLPNLLATELSIVLPLVTDLGEGWLHWPSVYRLLELNDSQLAAVNMTSKQMKAHVDRRKQIMNELKTIDAASCDSTNMVKKPADDPPPSNGKKAKSTTAKKGNPAAAGILIGGAAVATGLAVGAMMPAQESCGDPPSIPMSCLGIGRNSSSCNSLLEDYRAWCSCQGGTFSTSTGSCNR